MTTPLPHHRATALPDNDRCRQACLTLVLVLCCLVGLAASPLRADTDSPGRTLDDPSPTPDPPAVVCEFPRPQDQLWLVSTRHLGGGCYGPDVPQLDVRYYQPEAGWRTSELPSLLAAQREAELSCVYVHGNRVDASAASAQGRGLYRRLVTGPSDAPPMCFVIWSWPSARVRGQLRDVRIKAQRTNVEGYYLGYTLSQFDRYRPLSLIGYSYGCRIITGGLHVRGGGVLAGRSLSSEDLDGSAHAPARVVLVAAALPSHWLSPGQYHHLACTQMDRLLLLYNSCDRVLKRYHLIDKGSHHQALGYTGMIYRTSLSPEQIEQRDACCIVGKSHEEQPYYRSPTLMYHVRRHALWDGGLLLPGTEAGEGESGELPREALPILPAG